MRKLAAIKVILDRAPFDRAFTLSEAYQWTIEAGLDRKRETVRMALWTACNRGQLDRVSTASAGAHAIATYARPGVARSVQKTITEWASEVIADAERELTPVEVLVRMTERGYVVQRARRDAIRYLANLIQRK